MKVDEISVIVCVPAIETATAVCVPDIENVMIDVPCVVTLTEQAPASNEAETPERIVVLLVEFVPRKRIIDVLPVPNTVARVVVPANTADAVAIRTSIKYQSGPSFAIAHGCKGFGRVIGKNKFSATTVCGVLTFVSETMFGVLIGHGP